MPFSLRAAPARKAPRMIGQYEIVGRLGRGAMGVVYEGRDAQDRRYALKLVRLQMIAPREREGLMRRFARETKIGMAVDHPNIVKTIGYGQEKNFIYLVLRKIDGQDLSRYLGQGCSLSYLARADIFIALLDAITYLHKRGVVHRDIKPSNIIIQPDGQPILTDFGVAHLAASQLTMSGDMLGTPTYMAPEQVHGEDVDWRADIYAVGATMYYAFTARLPFLSRNLPALLMEILHTTPDEPLSLNPLLPPELSALIAKALEKDRAARFADALTMRAELLALREDIAAMDTTHHHAQPIKAKPMAVDQTMSSLTRQLGDLLHLCISQTADETRTLNVIELVNGWLQLADHLELPRLAPKGAHTARDEAIAFLRGGAVHQLSSLIATSMPIPRRSAQPRQNWLGLVRLLEALFRMAERLGEEDLINRARDNLDVAFTAVFETYGAQLKTWLDRGGAIPLMQLSSDFIRLEIIQQAIARLRTDVAATVSNRIMARAAMMVIHKISGTIEGYLAGGDESLKDQVAAALEEMEELIVLIDHAMNDHATRTLSSHSLGDHGLQDFVRSASLLADVILRDLRLEIGDADALLTRLRQLGSLYSFARRLDAGGTHTPLAGLMQRIHASVHEMTTHLAAQSAVATGERRVQLARLNRQIYDQAQALGWSELAHEMLQHARQEGLRQGSA
ncbi:MAG: serine/threonine-protein kinase [Pseudomonadota bacterium]